MSPTVEALPIKAMEVAEGPHWDAKSASLYFIDVFARTLHRFHPATSSSHCVKLDVPESLGFVTPVAGSTDKLVVASGNTLYIVQWDGVSDKVASIEVLHHVKEELETNRINDGKADPTGRLFFGTIPRAKEHFFTVLDGSFYSYSKSEGTKKHLGGIGMSNGLTWDEANGVMYWTDSATNRVDALDWDKSGAQGNRRPVFDLKKNKLDSVPDGMTIDTEGKLWLATYLGTKVLKIDPETSTILEEVKMPTKNVTSVAWGGAELSDLYVTTGQDAGDPKGGLVYRVRGLGSRGLPSVDFSL